MSEPEALVAARNLRATYRALASAAPGTEFHQEEGFVRAENVYDHPVCNFAFELDLNPWVARRLAEIGGQKKSFHIYRTPGDRPAHLDELLARVGFETAYRLKMLTAQFRAVGEGLDEATDRAGRRAVATFMVNQFFARHTPTSRRWVAEATADAGLRLVGLKHRGSWVAAAMLHEDAEVIGVYNVCVAASQRGRGWGARLVREIVAVADEKPLTLQCDPKLATWYASLGFRAVGDADVFRLADRSTADIMR